MILLDSHVYIWLLYEPERIGKGSKARLSAGGPVYVSTVSLWELALKHKVGKLPYTPQDLNAGVAAAGLEFLTLKQEHILKLQDVLLPHKDPFDAMLVAQSVAENLTLLTVDENLLALNNVLDASK